MRPVVMWLSLNAYAHVQCSTLSSISINANKIRLCGAKPRTLALSRRATAKLAQATLQLPLTGSGPVTITTLLSLLVTAGQFRLLLGIVRHAR
jgi:hypothetical protein